MAGYLHAFKRIKHLKGLRKPYEETRRFLGPDVNVSNMSKGHNLKN